MLAPLLITQRSVAGIVILDLSGKLVFDDGDRLLRDHVAGVVAAGERQILLNLEDVTHVDSGGVGALVTVFLHTVKRGGHLKLLAPGERVGKVLHMTRLDDVFEIFQEEAQALRSFSAGMVTRSA